MQGQVMAAILDFMGMQLSDHSKNPPNRFPVPMNLGVEPKIMSLAHNPTARIVMTILMIFNDRRVVVAILYFYV